jgi:hypothetical protein
MDKQAEELDQLREQLEARIPVKPKPSVEWLNLNKIKESVIR